MGEREWILLNPGPANTWVLLDEDYYSINDAGAGCGRRSAVQTRPVFTSSSWISCIRLCSLRLELSCAIERCMRRVQFKLAFVPGTLKRYVRASRSVIMTMAIHESLLKRASMIAG